MKKIAMYLRLSLPDIDLGLNGKEESNSIENQRLLIRNYLETHEELVGEVLEYKDDGYSGMNFERPGFKQMIQDAKQGVIGTIIVKDLSRFGREYIGMGDYMEQILPSLGVRLIAINSKYDSQAQGAGAFSMDVSINNMINNMYSRDLSKKLRSSFKAKWNSSIDTSGSVPFGYKREKSDLGVCLVIDQTAAEIVRTIFALANKGYNSKEIAEYLNAHDVPTPLLYRQKQSGCTVPRYVHNVEEQLWNTHKVLMILKRLDYTGVRVHGKYEEIGVASGKRKVQKPQDWIMIDNSHPAIVTKENFETAQAIIRRKKPAQNWNQNQDVFRGKLRCGCCGNVLQVFYPGDNILYCQHARDVGSKSKCNRDSYDKQWLQTVIFSSLHKHVDELARIGAELKKRGGIRLSESQKLETGYRQELNNLSDQLIREYENYVNGYLQREKFIEIKKGITARKKELEQKLMQMEEIKSESEILDADISNVVSWEREIREKSQHLASAVNELIQEVFVYSKDEIEIVFNFEDIFEKALAAEKQPS